MVRNLEAYKPAAPARVHLLLAAIMWTVVGSGLLFFGIRWLQGAPAEWVWWLLGGAVLVGLAKGHFMLEPAARRIVARIRARGDGRCIGGFLSLRTWAMVGVMMVAGRLLRGRVLPLPVVGFVYAAVGSALVSAARCLWYAWYRHNAVT